MKWFRLSCSLALRNLKTLLLFELAYKGLCGAALFPAAWSLFSLSMRAAGLSYLTGSTLSAYLKSPLTLLLLIFLAFLVTVAVLVEITALIYLFDASRHDEDVSVAELFRIGLSDAFGTFRLGSLGIIPYVLLLIPFLDLGVQSSVISSLDIPEFIEDYIYASLPLSVGYWALLLLLSVFAMNRLFSLHYFALYDLPFNAACKRSRRLMQGKLLETFGMLLLWNVCTMLVFQLGSYVFLELVVLLGRFLPMQNELNFAYIVGGVGVQLLAHLGNLLSLPVSYALLSGMFYTLRESAGEAPLPFERLIPRKIPRAFKVAGTCVLVGLCLTTLVLGAQQTLPFVNIEPDSMVQVQAHRGDSVAAPENTMPAFEAAIADGADWIELDVHQTADGVIVVMHDADLKRIAGVNKRVWELTYDELEQYDTGSWFDPSFSYVRISTLDEVLKAAKGRIKLNIELKPTGHETDFEADVIRLVRENGFVNNCVLASLNYQCLENIKRIDPEMRTLYIMAFAMGNIDSFTAADDFSLESSFINENLLAKLNAGGHRVFAWTVNQESNAEHMIQLGVDAIITDDPAKTKELINSRYLPERYRAFIRWQLPQAAPVDPADAKLDNYDLGAYDAAE